MHEAFHGKVARVVAVLHINEARSPDFARYIAVSVQRAGRHADHLIAEQAVLQEVIEHAGGELPAHGSAFEHQVHGHGFLSFPSRFRGERGRGRVRLACARRRMRSQAFSELAHSGARRSSERAGFPASRPRLRLRARGVAGWRVRRRYVVRRGAFRSWVRPFSCSASSIARVPAHLPIPSQRHRFVTPSIAMVLKQ